MEEEQFVNIVRQFPQIWDRNHPHFREKIIKDKCWNEIGVLCGKQGAVCKERFKAIREKYLREREKVKQLGNSFTSWKLLDTLHFLEPHIVPRKQCSNFNDETQVAEKYSSTFNVSDDLESSTQAFDTALIQLVKISTPIWNRSSKTFTSKQIKFELWKSIGEKLKCDPNKCMLRWKALREKYIRQKAKFQEGEQKWCLLDEMSFLDNVIHYRKKNSEKDSSINSEDSCHYNFPSKSSSEISNENTTDDTNVHSNSDSEDFKLYYSCDYMPDVKQEQGSEIPDSSNDINNVSVQMKDTQSIDESEIPAKIAKYDTHMETQDQLFGNLVAVMLSKKTEKEKNTMMMEIMKILTK